MKKLIAILIMTLLSNSTQAVSNYEYNKLVDEYNDIRGSLSDLEDKYNLLVGKYNTRNEETYNAKHNIKSLKANACGDFRIVDINLKKQFPTANGIKEHGDYVYLDKLEQVFRESLSGESKNIGQLFDVMYSIRGMEQRISKEYIAISILSSQNDQYLDCLSYKEGIHDSDVKRKFGRAKRAQLTKFLDAVVDTRRELSGRLDTYSFEVNEKLQKESEATR